MKRAHPQGLGNAPIPRYGATALSAAAGVLLIFLLTAHHTVLSGAQRPRWDGSQYHAPGHALLGDHARAGRLLLWNPWVAGGSPDAANPILGCLSPLHLAFALATGGALDGYLVFWLGLWWLGGVGTMLLARQLGAPLWGAVIAGLATLGSGVSTGHAQHLPVIESLAFLPFLVLALEKALASRRSLPALRAGALWGLSGLGGYPALTMMNGLFLALWTGVRLLGPISGPGPLGGTPATGDPPRKNPGLRRAVVTLVLSGVVGLIVMAPAVLLFFSETAGYSFRTGPLPRSVAIDANALHPGALATFASPALPTLLLATPSVWRGTDVSSVGLYLPALVLALAGAALTHRGERRSRWALAAVGLFFLAASLGSALPVRGLLYDLLPPMRFFRHAAFLRAYALFTAVLLAALATRDLGSSDSVRRGDAWRRLPVGATLLAALASLVLLAFRDPAAARGGLPAALALGAAVWWASAGCARLASYADRRRWRRFAAIVLTAAVAIDSWLAIALARDLNVAGGTWVEAWQRAERSHRPGLDLTPTGLSRLPRSAYGEDYNNRNVVAKEPAFVSYSVLSYHGPFYVDWIGDPVLLDSVTGAERLWFSPHRLEVPRTGAAFLAFRDRASALGAPPIVTHDRESTLSRGQPTDRELDEDLAMALAELPAARRIPARVLVHRPGVLKLRIDLPEPGFVLVTDRFARGWTAEVDGRRQEVLPGNFLFRALELPAGESEIRMAYRPRGLGWSLGLGWGSLLAIAGLSLPRRS